MNRNALPAALLALALALPSAADAACVVPGRHVVPAGDRVVLRFGPGLSPSVQEAFRRCVAIVAPIVDTGARPYYYDVTAGSVRPPWHAITGTKGGHSHTAVATSIAGRNWSASDRIRDSAGRSEYALTIACHETGWAVGLRNVGGDETSPSQCPTLAGKTVMFHHTAYDGRPFQFGSTDLATLRRIYGG